VPVLVGEGESLDKRLGIGYNGIDG